MPGSSAWGAATAPPAERLDLLVNFSDAATGDRNADILAQTLEIHAEDDQLFENARFAQATIPGALASCASRAGGTSWRSQNSLSSARRCAGTSPTPRGIDEAALENPSVYRDGTRVSRPTPTP